MLCVFSLIKHPSALNKISKNIDGVQTKQAKNKLKASLSKHTAERTKLNSLNSGALPRLSIMQKRTLHGMTTTSSSKALFVRNFEPVMGNLNLVRDFSTTDLFVITPRHASFAGSLLLIRKSFNSYSKQLARAFRLVRSEFR